MKLPIRIRVALYVTVSYAVVIIALSYALTELYEEYSYSSFDVTLQAAASSITNRLSEGNFKKDLSGAKEDVEETVASFENNIGVIRIGVFDKAGKEIFSLNDQDSITSKIPFGTKKECVTVPSEGKRYRAAFANFEINENSQGTIVALGSLSATDESIDRIRGLIFAVAPITILIVGIGSVLIARRALRPLEMIAHDIDRIQVDKPLSELRVTKTNDEIEKVALSFNALVRRIISLLDSQRNFVMDVSHELKTPLTVIQTEIEMLLMKSNLTSEERENLQQLVSEVEYASKLAIDLIYLSKLESSVVEKFSPVDFDSVAEEVISHQLFIAKRKNIFLQIKLGCKREVNANAQLLQRAFSNIIENAIKYSRNGGRVSVSTSVNDKSSMAAMLVEDDGVGISEEELPRVFDRFYRTKSSRSGNEKGSGLGLAIAKRIIEEHKGKIEIKSKIGVGTSVEIQVPTVK